MTTAICDIKLGRVILRKKSLVNTPKQQSQKWCNVVSCLVSQNERGEVKDFPNRNSFYSLIGNSLIVIHAEKNFSNKSWTANYVMIEN